MIVIDRDDLAWEARSTSRYCGWRARDRQMAAYVWRLHARGELTEDESSSDGQGEGWARFGRRVLSWDSHGFVELTKFDSEREAARWCALNVMACEFDIVIESRGEDSWIVYHSGGDSRVVGPLSDALALASEVDIHDASVWVDGQLYDETRGVPIDSAYLDAMEEEQLTTTTSYGHWSSAGLDASPRDAVLTALTGGGHDWIATLEAAGAVDAVTDGYIAAINRHLPSGVTLNGSEVFGPHPRPSDASQAIGAAVALAEEDLVALIEAIGSERNGAGR